MKNLGKIAIVIFILISNIYASVTANIEPNTIYKGDTVTYNLVVEGKNVVQPHINNICGNSILSTSKRTSIEMVNGDYKKNYIFSYGFIPTKECTIDGIEVEIDGNLEKVNPVKVNVKPVSQTLNGDFVLSLIPSKTDLYVGEPFILTLLLKQKRTSNVVDSKFVAPDFKGFWKKAESNPQRYEESGYIVTKMQYKLAAQREGNLTITPAQLKIAKRVGINNWASLIPQIKWKSYFSNEVNIQAKALPNNAKLVGDFNIIAIVDKTKIDANEALNVTIKVNGEGNFEDIDGFKPYIDGVNVFDEKINLDSKGFSQKLVFVSDTNFTIPPFELVYFNLNTKKVQKIKTNPINITVNGSANKQNTNQVLNIKKADTNTDLASSDNNIAIKADIFSIVLAFIVGLALGVSLLFIKQIKFKLANNKKSFNIKDEKLLFVKLMPYKDDKDVANILNILESNIYLNTKEKIDKKLLKDIVKKYNIN
jgi:hypothetical protein